MKSKLGSSSYTAGDTGGSQGDHEAHGYWQMASGPSNDNAMTNRSYDDADRQMRRSVAMGVVSRHPVGAAMALGFHMAPLIAAVGAYGTYKVGSAIAGTKIAKRIVRKSSAKYNKFSRKYL